jgi:hypothetical protein
MNTFLTLVCVVFLGNSALSQLEKHLNSEHPKINFNGIQTNGKTNFLNFAPPSPQCTGGLGGQNHSKDDDEDTPTVPTA